MKIYISLPITGQETLAREKADRVKAALSRMGHHPVNPFDVYAGQTPEYADYLCCDLRALADCDAVYFCQGWDRSRGCRIEAAFASEMGIAAMYEESDGDREARAFLKEHPTYRTADSDTWMYLASRATDPDLRRTLDDYAIRAYHAEDYDPRDYL